MIAPLRTWNPFWNKPPTCGNPGRCYITNVFTLMKRTSQSRLDYALFSHALYYRLHLSQEQPEFTEEELLINIRFLEIQATLIRREGMDRKSAAVAASRALYDEGVRARLFSYYYNDDSIMLIDGSQESAAAA